MRFLVLFSWLIASVLVYWWLVRPWLRSRPALAGVWARVDSWEATLWARSRTILVARLGMLGSGIVAVHDYLVPFLSGVDLTPMVPDTYKPFIPLALPLMFAGFEFLRWVTRRPVDNK